MTDFVMPVAFYFKVEVDGASQDQDMAFQEVGGLSAEVELETVQEGGENRFAHRLPKPAKHPNLVLKRGIAGVDSTLAKWCQDVLEKDFAEAIVPHDIVVSLCDADGNPSRTWSIGNAWPVKWSVSDLNSTKNEIAVETIEFAYNTLTRKV